MRDMLLDLPAAGRGHTEERNDGHGCGSAMDLTCANCGTPLSGRFCPACGQDRTPPPASATRFLLGEAATLIGYDSRLGHSLWRLISRPGHLTQAFVAGHRVRYLAPLSLYLLLAGAFFLLHNFHPFVSFDPRSNSLRSGFSAISLWASLTPEQLSALAAAGIGTEVFAERFGGTATALLPLFFLLSLVLFSAATWVFNRRAAVAGLTAATFALHWGAFYLGFTTVDRLLALAGVASVPLARLYSLVSLGYLCLALRRVYQRAWPVVALQGVALLAWFYVLLALWETGVMATAVALTVP